jgi:hypothetical protein
MLRLKAFLQDGLLGKHKSESNGSASASACSNRASGYRSRAMRTCAAEKSIPIAAAPRCAAAPAM